MVGWWLSAYWWRECVGFVVKQKQKPIDQEGKWTVVALNTQLFTILPSERRIKREPCMFAQIIRIGYVIEINIKRLHWNSRRRQVLDSSERCLSLSSPLKPSICTSYAHIFSSSFYYHSISNLRQNKIVFPKNKKLLKKAAKRKEWKTPFFYSGNNFIVIFLLFYYEKYT